VDSNRLSGSTVFSSQDEDEEEESAFESAPDAAGRRAPEGQEEEVGGAGGERRAGRLKEAGSGEEAEPAVAGPSDGNTGEMKHGFLLVVGWSLRLNHGGLHIGIEIKQILNKYKYIK